MKSLNGFVAKVLDTVSSNQHATPKTGVLSSEPSRVAILSLSHALQGMGEAFSPLDPSFTPSIGLAAAA